MEKYIFKTHGGISQVTDTENGVTIEWENGRFNETNTPRLEPTAKIRQLTDAGKIAATMARACKEIGDYVLENYPDFVDGYPNDPNETDPAKIIVKTTRFFRGMGWEHEYLDGHTEEEIVDEWFNCEYPEGWTDKTPVIPDVVIEYHITPQKQ
jgi:hypothetical protein